MLANAEVSRYSPFREPEVRKETLVANAFVQLFIKKDEHVGCLTYPVVSLPTASEARNVVIHILFPDGVVKGAFYQSSDGNLQFVVKHGIDLSVLSRFFAIPGQMWEIDQREKTGEFASGVGKEFFACINGRNHQSGCQSTGKHVFAFSYRQREDGLYGIGTDGREIRLSNLAAKGYDDHARMLSKLEASLLSMDEGMAIHISFDGTVDPCCGNFFRTKMGGEDGDERHGFGNSSRYDNFYACGGPLRTESSSLRWCSTCKKFYTSSERHECKKENKKAA